MFINFPTLYFELFYCKIREATAKIVREVENDGGGREYSVLYGEGGGGRDQLILVRPPSTLIHTAKKVEKVVAELFLQR